MVIPKRRRGMALCVLFLALGMCSACAGDPYTAPKQPVKGVDTPDRPVENPNDVPGEPRDYN